MQHIQPQHQPNQLQLDVPPDAHQPKHLEDRSNWSKQSHADYSRLAAPAAPEPLPLVTKSPLQVDDPAEPNGWLPDVDSNLIDTGQKQMPRTKNNSSITSGSLDEPSVPDTPSGPSINDSGNSAALVPCCTSCQTHEDDPFLRT